MAQGIKLETFRSIETSNPLNNKAHPLLKPVLALIALCIVWALIPVAMRSVMRVSFFELQAPLPTGASFVSDIQSYLGLKNHSKHELIEATRDLARLNASYELKIQENAALKNEVYRLEKILSIPPQPGYHFEIARVSSRDINSWWQQLTIRKGSNHGIHPGAAVIYSGGVVGRVKEVHAYSSTVELVTNPNFRIAAHIENDARPLTYRGFIARSLRTPLGEIHDAPTDLVATHNEPLRLVTTQLGGSFPEGLTIGYIDNLHKESDGLFQTGKVKLDPRLLELQEVVVLLPLVENEEVAPHH